MEVQLAKENTIKIDNSKILNRIIWVNRVALFVVFYWFGFLKLANISPAEGLVTSLHKITLSPLIDIESFLIVLGVLECFIGLLWLVPKATKWAFVLFCAQIFATFLPLLLCPAETWQNIMVLTLTGQYIVKNVVLIACACTIYFSWKN
jgi:uncharacterized membrane protein YphA (DoxX/SURF4 family)